MRYLLFLVLLILVSCASQNSKNGKYFFTFSIRPASIPNNPESPSMLKADSEGNIECTSFSSSEHHFLTVKSSPTKKQRVKIEEIYSLINPSSGNFFPNSKSIMPIPPIVGGGSYNLVLQVNDSTFSTDFYPYQIYVEKQKLKVEVYNRINDLWALCKNK